MTSAEQHLQAVISALAGPEARPRDDQRVAVEAILQPRSRVLVVQATGWGKSAVYWAATAALRAAGAGPTVVVSPLLVLMRNQVEAAERAGLRAATIHSGNHEAWDLVFDQLAADALDVLLISPERLGNPGFASRFEQLRSQAGLLVIDEAHCISDWGFDFRPDYQRLSRLLVARPEARVLSTTATANARVARDVARQLGEGAITLRGTLARTSLRLSVVPGLHPLERYAWVAEALRELPGSGIIYVLVVAEAERLARFLQEQGHAVEPYTGQQEGGQREELERRLKDNQVKALVATSALGMGYDKPDLGFCIHVGSPSTPVAYYQQVGRAGRGLARAEAILLPSASDERVWDYFATATIPRPEHVDRVVRALTADGAQSLVDLVAATGIPNGRLDGLLKLLLVDEVVRKEGSAYTLTGRPYVHDAAKWADVEATRREEATLMRRYAHGEGCLMVYLQQALDDPSAAPCGRCSVCTGQLPSPGARPSATLVQAARAFVRGHDTVIEPRKLWPRGVARSKKITGCSEGRAVAFADDPGWSDELALLQQGGDAVIAPELLQGAIQTLGRWAKVWAHRPRVVVAAPAWGSAAEGNRQLAEALARVGKLELLDVFAWNGTPTPEGLASAAHIRHLEQAVRLTATTIPPGPILLVATAARTAWTLTVAAALLREHGATEVLPLVLHKRP